MTSLGKSDNYVAHLKKRNKINSDFLILILNGDIYSPWTWEQKKCWF